MNLATFRSLAGVLASLCALAALAGCRGTYSTSPDTEVTRPPPPPPDVKRRPPPPPPDQKVILPPVAVQLVIAPRPESAASLTRAVEIVADAYPDLEITAVSEISTAEWLGTVLARAGLGRSSTCDGVPAITLSSPSVVVSDLWAGCEDGPAIPHMMADHGHGLVWLDPADWTAHAGRWPWGLADDVRRAIATIPHDLALVTEDPEGRIEACHHAAPARWFAGDCVAVVAAGPWALISHGREIAAGGE